MVPLRAPGAVLALVAMLAPWAGVVRTSAHVLTNDHHQPLESDHVDGAADALHGHGHEKATPAHDHGSTLPKNAHALRPLAVSVRAFAPPGAEAPASLWSFVPAPSASPPRLKSIVLRI
jgi:hypothetical protein